jgi:hypothetical protein
VASDGVTPYCHRCLHECTFTRAQQAAPARSYEEEARAWLAELHFHDVEDFAADGKLGEEARADAACLSRIFTRIAEQRAAEAVAERDAATVAWLRAGAPGALRLSVECIADALERGDHVRAK